MNLKAVEHLFDALEKEKSEDDRFFSIFFEAETDKFQAFRSRNLDMGDAMLIIIGLAEHYQLQGSIIADLINGSDGLETGSINYDKLLKDAEIMLDVIREAKERNDSKK